MGCEQDIGWYSSSALFLQRKELFFRPLSYSSAVFAIDDHALSDSNRYMYEFWMYYIRFGVRVNDKWSEFMCKNLSQLFINELTASEIAFE